MIECKAEKYKNLSVKVEGSIETIITETNALIGEIYQSIKEQNPVMAMLYRTAVVAALSDPNNYAWRDEDEKGGENLC